MINRDYTLFVYRLTLEMCRSHVFWQCQMPASQEHQEGEGAMCGEGEGGQGGGLREQLRDGCTCFKLGNNCFKEVLVKNSSWSHCTAF